MALRFSLSRIPSRFMSQVFSDNHIDSVSQKNIKTIEQNAREDDLYRYVWLKCQAHDTAILDSYETFVKTAARNLDIDYERTEEPFRRIKRRTLLASRFVHKKYRVQYEIRSYYRNMLFKNLTGSTADTFLEYVERNLPEGVLLIAEKHQLCELPFDLKDRINP